MGERAISQTITQDYRNAFTEVYTILKYIETDDYEKIPSEIIEVIEENRNKEYEYEMNEDVDIFNQPMLPETKAMLFNFFRDYWATPEQTAKIKRMQREDLLRIEEEKKKKYNNTDIFKNNNLDTSNKNQIEETALVEIKKDSLWTKIIRRIKALFNF